MTARHSQQTPALGIHTPYRWLWADAAAQSAETDVLDYDVDNASVGLIQDENTEWRATDTVPTWVQIGSGGAGSNQHVIDVADNASILPVVELFRRTTATPLDGIGGSLDINVDNGADVVAGRVIAAWKDVTGGDSVILLTMAGAATDGIGLAIGPVGSAFPIADLIPLIGAGAVDLMPRKQTSASIPTGSGAGLFAGQDNEATGDNAVVLGGSDNLAAADDSIAMGIFSKSRFRGSVAHASSKFANRGDQQRHCFSVSGVTLDNLDTPLLTADGGNLPFADDTTFTIKLELDARCTTAPPLNAHYEGWCRGYCAAGVVTISASAKVIESEDTGVWDFNFAAASNEVVINVNGMPADTVYWSGWIILTEIIG